MCTKTAKRQAATKNTAVIKKKKTKKKTFTLRNNNTHVSTRARGNPINWILVWTPNASRRLNSQMAVREMLFSAWVHVRASVQHLDCAGGYMYLSGPKDLWHPNQLQLSISEIRDI